MRTIKHRFTGEEITFLKSTHETKDKYLHIEVKLPPKGDGPPLHVHDSFEETFEVMSGTLTITTNKLVKDYKQGEKVHAPRLMPHTFKNNSNEEVVFQVKLVPGIMFEESARIHYGLMDDGLTKNGNPIKFSHLALIMTMQETYAAGLPVGLQKKIFGWIVKRAKKKGEYKALEKYIGKPIR